MERLLDKAAVFTCCLATLVLAGEVTQADVALCCAAVLASALAELAFLARKPLIGTILPLAACLSALILPAGIAMLPLVVYDLARTAWRLPALAAPAAILIAATRISTDTPWLPASCLAIASALLALRTERAVERTTENHCLRDHLQEKALALEAKNRELIDRQGYEVELATLSERARIAREIHDNVGHLLTRAGLQVEALRVLHADDDGVQRGLAGVGTTLSEALDSVRRSVHDLHDDAVSLSVQLDGIARKVRDASGLAIDLDASIEHAPAAVASCFTAIVQEALSNTLRHSTARRVQVRCLEHPAFWQLIVTEQDGAAPGDGLAPRSFPPDPTSSLAGAPENGLSATPELSAPAKLDVDSREATPGLGLASMRERVESLGGQFRAGHGQGTRGFKVFATIPKGGA